MIKPIKHPALESDGITHGFFTRKGGVSKGIYKSLNCGSGSMDSPLAISENRKRAMASFKLDQNSLITAWQSHSSNVQTINEQNLLTTPPKCDALVTKQPGLALGVLTADCAPVIFANKKYGVIGIAHAGWRGALNGILEETIFHMSELGATPNDTKAIVGPAIGQGSYEVSDSFRDKFIQKYNRNKTFFIPSTQHNFWMFDLSGYILARLENAGIGLALSINMDTYVNKNEFFSYRRTCHNGSGDYGRLLSAIALEI